MMSDTERPTALALLVAADLVECALYLSVSIPAAVMTLLSQLAIVLVATGLWGGMVLRRSLCFSFVVLQECVRLTYALTQDTTSSPFFSYWTNVTVCGFCPALIVFVSFGVVNMISSPLSSMNCRSIPWISDALLAVVKAKSMASLCVKFASESVSFEPKLSRCSNTTPTSHVSVYLGWGGFSWKTPHMILLINSNCPLVFHFPSHAVLRLPSGNYLLCYIHSLLETFPRGSLLLWS